MTSSPLEMLISVDRGQARTLGGQIEDQIRAAIRDGRLAPGAVLPSTRVLARQIEVSRPIVVDAYAQLAAEGYLRLRQGARPAVATSARPEAPSRPLAATEASRPRFDFRPAIPDLAAFPRAAWLRALRQALTTLPDQDLGYGGEQGVAPLREAVCAYLGRVRGVVAEPGQVVITSGFYEGRTLVCRALSGLGRRRLGLEDPGYNERDWIAPTGLSPIPIPVDAEGLRIDALTASGADAAIVTPSHQFPTGVVMSGRRRGELLAWLRDTDAVVLEDDYDAEHRYDRAPVGALQGLDPGRVIYAGTVSKTLAPALRIGWLVAPPRWLDAIRAQQSLAGAGCPRIEQHALATFLTSGAFDRHLRRMRLVYRDRRDALVEALAGHIPEARVGGISAGLHATVELPDGFDERAIIAAAARRGVALEAMGGHRFAVEGPPTLLLGYGQASEATIRVGVRALAAAMEETRPAALAPAAMSRA